MRLLLSVAFALTSLCRLAAAGEGVALSNADPMLFALVRLFGDFGMAGAFIAYLIWQRKKDGETRAEDNERWHQQDEEIKTLVKDSTKVSTEVVAVLGELRRIVSDNSRKISDAVKQKPTRVMRRDETDTE